MTRTQVIGEGGHYPRFSSSEYERRFALVDRLCDQHGLDALVIHGAGPSGGRVQYLSGYVARQSTWLVYSRGQECTLFLHFLNHVPNAEAMSITADIRPYWPSAPQSIAEELQRRGAEGGKVGVVGLANSIPHHQFAQLAERADKASFTDVARPYDQIRWVRSDEELQWFARSGELLDDACDLVAERLRPGLTELDVKALIHESFVPRGGEEGIIFISSTSMSEPARKSPWQFPSSRTIETGDVVITELTISHYGYGAQIHRPFAVGVEPNSLYEELFAAAQDCFESVRRVLRKGASSEEVVGAGDVPAARGFRVFDSLVHGEGGKNPELGAPGSDHGPESWTFEEGQVMMLQPNPVTADGRAGLQAGCAVRIAGSEAEPLHGYPLQFPVCK